MSIRPHIGQRDNQAEIRARVGGVLQRRMMRLCLLFKKSSYLSLARRNATKTESRKRTFSQERVLGYEFAHGNW